MQRPLCSDDAEPWLMVDALLCEAEEAHSPAAEESAPAAFGDGTTTLPSSLDADELAALVRRVVDQDQVALAQLYDALSGRVFACAQRVTRQVAASEEVTQDTFWQVWRQAPRFDPLRGAAHAWILNIARSRALDHVRRVQRERLHGLELVQHDAAQTAGNPQDLFAGLQRDTRLQQLLTRLDPLKRQLVALAYDRGLTQQEIALHTGMPLGTVKSLLRRTLLVLRETLQRDGSIELDSRA